MTVSFMCRSTSVGVWTRSPHYSHGYVAHRCDAQGVEQIGGRDNTVDGVRQITETSKAGVVVDLDQHQSS